MDGQPLPCLRSLSRCKMASPKTQMVDKWTRETQSVASEPQTLAVSRFKAELRESLASPSQLELPLPWPVMPQPAFLCFPCFSVAVLAGDMGPREETIENKEETKKIKQNQMQDLPETCILFRTCVPCSKHLQFQFKSFESILTF